MIHNPALAQEFLATVGEFSAHRDRYFALVTGLGATPIHAELALSDVLRQSSPDGSLMEQYDFPPDAVDFVLWGTFPADVSEEHLRLARFRPRTEEAAEGLTTLLVTASGDTLNMTTREYDYAGTEAEPTLGHIQPRGEEVPVEAESSEGQAIVDEFTTVLGAMRRANESLRDPASILSHDLKHAAEHIVA